MSALYNQKTLSDVTFVVGKQPDTRTFYAHKFILTMSSPVFEAWFRFSGELTSGGLTGPVSEEKEISLTDEEPEAFKNLLLFIYTDEVDINAANVLGVLYTAKKYQITCLERHCINYLETCLEPESAFFLLTKVRTELNFREEIRREFQYLNLKSKLWIQWTVN